MKKITPFLWYEKDMKGITDFYLSVFSGSKLKNKSQIEDTPSGVAQMATIEIYGMDFNLMTAGPYLPFNPTVSFIISCDTIEEVDTLWGKLSEKGKILMELSSYPFAEKYGWIQDMYGVSWQIMYSTTNKGPVKVIPTLMFAGDVCGRAQEAIDFYTAVFHDSQVGYVMNYDGSEPVTDDRAKVKHAGIKIEDFNMALMDSGMKSPLSFAQAVSFVVHCNDQAEVDYYYDRLTEEGTEVQCGWINDKFGFPWQIVPSDMERMLSTGTPEQIARVTEAFMKMKKFDIKTLQRAFDGE